MTARQPIIPARASPDASHSSTARSGPLLWSAAVGVVAGMAVLPQARVGLAAVGVIAAGSAIIALPFWGVVVSVVVDGVAGYVTWHDISLFGCTLALVAAGAAARLPSGTLAIGRPVLSRLVVPFALFLALLTASVLVASDRVTSIRYVLNYGAGAVFAVLVAVLVSDRRRFETILVVLFALTVAGAVLGILQVLVSSRFLIARFYLRPLDAWVTEYARLPRGFGLSAVNMNFGKDMVVGWLAALAMVLGLGWRWRPWLCAITILLSMAGLVLSGTRSSWVGAIVGLGVVIVALRSHPQAARRLAVFGLIAVPAVLALVVGLSGLALWKIDLSRPMSDNLRIALTVAGLRLFEASPWLGVGIGNFRLHYPAFLPDDLGLAVIDPRTNLPAHNVFLEILTGAGWMALVAYLVILVNTIRSLVGQLRSPDADTWTHSVAAGLLGTLVAYLLDSLFHNYGFDNRLWLLVGLAYALPAAARHLRRESADAARA